MIVQGLVYMVLGMGVVSAFLLLLVLAVSFTSLLLRKLIRGEGETAAPFTEIAAALAAVFSHKGKQ